MEYAGFWKRFCAGWIDFFVMLPFMLVFELISSLSKEAALVTAIPSSALFWFYNIYFHGRWGATAGKMAVKIKVVKATDGSDLTSTPL